MAGCGEGGGVGRIGGTVVVDGAPVDSGTISFRPVEGDSARGSGAAISAGQFKLPAEPALPPGKYQVIVQASKKTGRMVKDPFSGDVAEMQPLTITNSPQAVDLTAATASNLALEFSTAAK
jgi:hypothetical protein